MSDVNAFPADPATMPAAQEPEVRTMGVTDFRNALNQLVEEVTWRGKLEGATPLEVHIERRGEIVAKLVSAGGGS